jgi:EmrB/QacA subfamily drug resistance transporter
MPEMAKNSSANAANPASAAHGTGRAAGLPIPDPNRWKALAFIALAQLMVVLDATIANIALPHAQVDLHISKANQQWVITAYALAFGGLLLFGGRIADMWGRRRAFMTGLIGFAGASALGGAAVDQGMLFGARALQGAFGALLAPAALSLLATTFTEAKERAKAFGIYGAIAGGGGAVGLLLGGALTQYLDWRWTFYVNVPFAIIAVLGAVFVIHEPRGGHNSSSLDIPGVLLATGGLVALVYGFTRAASDGWSDPVTIAMFVATVVLLGSFVLVESRVSAPLLPLRVVTDRNRGGAYASLGLAVIAMFGLFFFLTLYMQDVRGYKAITTGFAFMPMIVGMITGSTQIGARLMNRVQPRFLMAPGFLLAAVGMLVLTQLKVDSSYASTILPAELLLGLGMGTAFMPAMSLATSRVQPRDAGVASAMVNTSQQVGGAIGTALLNTIAASAATHWAHGHLARAKSVGPTAFNNIAEVHGFTTAIWWAVAILVVAAAIAATLINMRPGQGQAVAAGSGTASEGAEDAASLAPPVIAH